MLVAVGLNYSYGYQYCSVMRLTVQVLIYDTFTPTKQQLLEISGNQGDEWKFAMVDINIDNRQPSVKIQVKHHFSFFISLSHSLRCNIAIPIIRLSS